MYAIQNDIIWQSVNTNDWQHVEFYPTPNKRGMMEPTSIVIRHIDTVLSAQAIAQYFQKPGVLLTGHLNIDAQGIVTQNVEFIVSVNNAEIYINICQSAPDDILQELTDIIKNKYNIKEIQTFNE